MIRLYVGNLPYECDDAELTAWFKGQGARVLAARVIFDHSISRSRGFGFVELEGNPGDLQQTIERFHGLNMSRRSLTVREAVTKERRQAVAASRLTEKETDFFLR